MSTPFILSRRDTDDALEIGLGLDGWLRLAAPKILQPPTGASRSICSCLGTLRAGRFLLTARLVVEGCGTAVTFVEPKRLSKEGAESAVPESLLCLDFLWDRGESSSNMSRLCDMILSPAPCIAIPPADEWVRPDGGLSPVAGRAWLENVLDFASPGRGWLGAPTWGLVVLEGAFGLLLDDTSDCSNRKDIGHR